METDKTRVQRGLDTLEGEIISGRYQILRRIGKGGMGVVYLAQQTNLDRQVCIKVLNPALLDDEDAVGRFQREAKGLSRLQHPNIVTIFDYGRDGNLAYIVMEYAQGETLGKYLKAHGAMTLDTFLPIAVQTLKGIGEAHKLGLIHRDIKPANIIICELEGETNFVKILDFGLAKLAQGGEDLTKDQQLVGSASYMSPEQILTGTSDTRTDVYALGVMFYYMLSGRKPFTGANDNAILYQHVNTTPSPLHTLLNENQGVPEELCEVIDQCLMKDPNKRPQTALDLLNAISYALDAPQIRAGFSSMSLPRVDLQKVSEEAETHFMQPNPGLQDAMNSAGEISNSMQSLPPMPTCAVAASSIAQNSANADATNTYDREPVSGAKDRKVLVIVLCAVAAIAAMIVTYVMIQTNQESDAETAAVAQTDNKQADDLNALFDTLNLRIKDGQWESAESLIEDIDKQIEIFQGDNKSKYVIQKNDAEHEISVGKQLDEAKAAAKAEKYEEAIALYEKILSKEKNNSVAEQELKVLQDLPQIVFDLEERNQAKLILDDVELESVPESIRLAPGSHTVRITRTGYKEYENNSLDLSKGEKLTLGIELTPKQTSEKKPSSGGGSNTRKSNNSGLLGDKSNSNRKKLL